MLEFENQIFLEILQEDGLVITAKGLGPETIFANILKVYQDPGNLVIVLGTTDHDEQFFMDKLRSMQMKSLPRIVTAQCTSNEREIMYLEGGVLFISGRILVVDLLKNRVPLHLVTGILVYRAHLILNSYQEAFALRLYRQHNKTGFIKAFSNSALAFTVGFAQVEKVMKALFIKKLFLWPRFHAIVNNSLSQHEPEVIELHVKITNKMLNIQTALLDLMNYIVKELKRINKYLDLDELTVENAISKKFHKQLQSQLDPMWHQLSSATKQLIADLKTLRFFVMCLTYENSVSFYASLNSLRTMNYAMKTSGWLMLDPVDNLFKFAKERVYNNKNELEPESNPKWEALTEVITEIQRDHDFIKNNADGKKILIVVHDGRTCNQLKNYLTLGSKKYLQSLALKKLIKNNCLKLTKASDEDKKKESDTKEESEENVNKDSDDDDEEKQDSYFLTLSQKLSDSQPTSSDGDSRENTLFEACSQIAELDLTSLNTSEPVIIIQSLKKDGDPMSLQRTLIENMPNYVIMYIADISAVRQLEVYQCNNPAIHLKVYFLIYGGSVEEQEYLTSLRREKVAFETLITAKTTMVVPEDQDGKSEDCSAFAIVSDQNIEENTRKGGIQESLTGSNKVIVDMREFRSELPALLHKRGIEIEPVTLMIGDYILSPDICVERKSISDLIGSLNSGRLYNQAVAMTRYYEKPMLLIEFDQNKPFSLQGHYYISKDMKSIDITAKLQLLTLHFPKLKLVWSPSPSATAQLFEELKQGREQPDSLKAAQVGVDENAEDKQIMLEKYNNGIQDFVAKLPGVHSKNLRIILNKGQSLNNLIKLTKDELSETVGNKIDAQILYTALHENCLPSNETSTSTRKVFSKGSNKKLFSKLKK